MPWHHKLRPTPISGREIANIGEFGVGGIVNLPQDLTINGQTVSPTFRYEARNATTGLWTATVGENLTGQGSGGIVGLGAPTPHDDDRSVNPDSTRYWNAGSNTFADVTTEDMVFECVFKFSAATELLFDKEDNQSPFYGIRCYMDANGRILFRVFRDAGSITPDSNTELVDGVWYHAMCFLDRDGSAQWYVNGQASGAATDIFANNQSLSNDDNFTVGATASGSFVYNQNIAYLAMWQKDDWLDTHLQAAVAEERSARLGGMYVPAWGKGPSQSLLRNSAATLEKRAPSGIQQLFQVGPKWSRTDQRPDNAYRYGSGVVSEAQYTNLLTYSEDLDNDVWDTTHALNASVSPNVLVAPDGTLTADAIHEDATAAAEHYLGQLQSEIIDSYVFQAYGKAINRRWLQLRMTAGKFYVNFDLVAGVIGVENKTNAIGMRYIGDGWYFCWFTFTGIESGSVARLVVLDDAQNQSFDGLDQDSVAVWGVQLVEGLAHPVSYIKTEGSEVTRLADRTQYDGLSLPASLTVAADFLVDLPDEPTVVPAELSDGTSDNRQLVYFVDGVERHFGRTPAGLQWFMGVAQGAYKERLWHEHRGTARFNEARQYLDGVEFSTPDLDCEMPARTVLDVGTRRDGGTNTDGLTRVRLFAGFEPEKDITDFGEIMSRASGYISTPAAAAQSTAYVNVGGTFTSVGVEDFTVDSAGIITYTGADTKRFVVEASMSGSISAGTPKVTTCVEKNGLPVAPSEVTRDVADTSIGAWSLHGDVELANGDTLNFATKVDTGTPNLTMDTLSFVVSEIS